MQCRLCLEEVSELKNSHYLSAGIFRHLRSEESDNPNPFHLTKRGTFQSSHQPRAHLLCGDCEQRLNKRGEDWVLRNCLSSTQDFSIKSLINATNPVVAASTKSTKIYSAAQTSKINVAALAYFSTSIFWRGSIYPWNSDRTIPVQLGRYGEDFRRFLMDISPFPLNAILWVIIRQDPKVSSVSHAPHAFKLDGVHSYRFAMPGLGFVLMVGKQIPDVYREFCFIHGSGSPIIDTDIVDRMLHSQVSNHVMRDAINTRKQTLL